MTMLAAFAAALKLKAKKSLSPALKKRNASIKKLNAFINFFDSVMLLQSILI